MPLFTDEADGGLCVLRHDTLENAHKADSTLHVQVHLVWIDQFTSYAQWINHDISIRFAFSDTVFSRYTFINTGTCLFAQDDVLNSGMWICTDSANKYTPLVNRGTETFCIDAMDSMFTQMQSYSLLQHEILIATFDWRALGA